MSRMVGLFVAMPGNLFLESIKGGQKWYNLFIRGEEPLMESEVGLWNLKLIIKIKIGILNPFYMVK